MAIKDVMGKAGFTLKKKLPEILVGVSVVGVGTTAVLAGKATLSLPQLLTNGKMFDKSQKWGWQTKTYPIQKKTRYMIEY